MAIETSTRLNRVKDHLLNYINTSQLKEGDRLPSESDLAKSLGVSRSTIREAYITLEAEGTIQRKHGVGTFVSRSPMIKESLLDDLTGFPSRIKSAGFAFGFELISITKVTPAAEVCHALQIETEEKVVQVKFVQFADGVPALYHINHFNTWIDESLFDWDRFEGNMLKFVSEILNFPERQFYTRILAAAADDDVSTYLSIPPKTPIVNVKPTVSTMDGRPISYSTVYLNPDNIEFELGRVYRHS